MSCIRMVRIALRLTISVSTVTALVWMTSCATMPAAQRVSTLQATHSYVVSGVGSPTVILESGLGDGRESWAPVFDQLTKLTRVIAYDRAGYGASHSANASRDGATIVRELRATLHAIGLSPPYVLVGHSVGGTYMELYARTHPQEVAGVVLIDSRHADFSRQCLAADARSCTPPALLKVLLPGAPGRELTAGDETMNQVMSGGPFPDVPIAVLTSTNKPLEGARFRQVWLQTQQQLATLSTTATHTICVRCGH